MSLICPQQMYLGQGMGAAQSVHEEARAVIPCSKDRPGR